MAPRPSWLAPRPSWLAPRPIWLAPRPSWLPRGLAGWPSRPGWLALKAWLVGPRGLAGWPSWPGWWALKAWPFGPLRTGWLPPPRPGWLAPRGMVGWPPEAWLVTPPRPGQLAPKAWSVGPSRPGWLAPQGLALFIYQIGVEFSGKPNKIVFNAVALVFKLLLVSLPPIVKSCMQSLYAVNLPPLCLGPPYHPTRTLGDPPTAQKRAETHPKTPRFPLSML